MCRLLAKIDDDVLGVASAWLGCRELISNTLILCKQSLFLFLCCVMEYKKEIVNQSFSDEDRQLFRSSLRTLLSKEWSSEKVLKDATDTAKKRKIWRHLSEMGLSALCASSGVGGLREAILAMHELGQTACIVPLRSAVLSNFLLKNYQQEVEIQNFLAQLHDGTIYPYFSFGPYDDDPGVGAVQLREGAATGQIRFAEGADSVSHFLFMLNNNGDNELTLVKRGGLGLKIVATPTFGINEVFEVNLNESLISWRCRLSSQAISDALIISRLLYMARACGAAQRSFDMVVDYAKERHQFGRPIGSFQSIQHKLADIKIKLSGLILTFNEAAKSFDYGQSEWRHFAECAGLYATRELRSISRETHHVFGAIGYAEEHEAPKHFRRIHLDVLRHGGNERVKKRVAQYFINEGGIFPEFVFGAEAEHFRSEVREWLEKHWPEDRAARYREKDTTYRDYDRKFSKEVGKTGWLGLTWPKKYGGMNRSRYELLAYLEEMGKADAPRAGAPIQAVAWMRYGTEAQKKRYLPELLRGDVIYGMWYSEPDSGSDLASLRTRATRDEDGWVINGQKIWTTSYWADYMWVAAKTDQNARPPHAGISMFVIPSNTPGIIRTPMRTMYGGEFCNTFFDDVRIPADALVGKVNHGWEVLMGSLVLERAYVGSRIMGQVIRMYHELCEYVRLEGLNEKAGENLDGAHLKLADIGARIEVGRQLALASITQYAEGNIPTWEAAMAKIFAGELMEELGELGLSIMGLRGSLTHNGKKASLPNKWEQKVRHSLMWVISMGTNEIQRNIIARKALGLPKG